MTANIKRPAWKILISKNFVFISILLIALYFISRLINLTNIPVFADEAIYIRWSQVMRAESTLRFLPLSDGKQPLFMWLTMPALKLFSDPLFTGRFVSVVSGFLTLIGLASLTWYLTKSRLAIILTSILYIIIPYTLFFDRFALADSLLNTFGVYSLLFGLMLINSPRLDLALLLGFSLGGGLITKSPSIFFIVLQPFLLISLKKLPTLKTAIKIILLWFVAAFIALVIFNILRLGPNFHMINARNYDYIFPISEVLTHPFNPLIHNLKQAFNWYFLLLTWPVIGAAIFSLNQRTGRRLALTLLLWAILPLLAQSLVAKVFTTRYLLYTTSPIIILASLFLYRAQIKLKNNTTLALIFLTIILSLIKSITLLTNPVDARIPEESRRGYFQDWTAGTGIKEVSEYLINRSKQTKILVGTEGFFGTLPDGLQIYTEKVPNLTVLGVGQPIFALPDSLKNSLSDNEVYLLANESRLHLTPLELTHLEPIASYEKTPHADGSIDSLSLYRLHPNPVR